MNSISDSDAFYNPERMLIQHQAALTILQGMVTDPDIEVIKWLDLASGKGQIIAHLNKNFSATERKKIHFQGFDVDNAHTRHAARIASNLELSFSNFEIGELSNFHEHSVTEGFWKFITLTNTIHEISPNSLANILVNCITRLSKSGCLFIYDMERLPSPELGAVLWTGAEMRSILNKIFLQFGCDEYMPAIGTWTHKTCDGWNAQIHRKHIDFPGMYLEKQSEVIPIVAKHITSLLKSKLQQVKSALESLTKFGPETGEETETKENLLFDFWAISRALEVSQ